MDEYRIITLYNPSKTPFDLFYNNSLTKTIPPGGYLRVPWNPLGILGEKHLIDRMCNENNEPTSDENIRQKYRSVILIQEESDDTYQNLTEEQKLQRKLDMINKTNSSDMIKVCDKCQSKTFNMAEHNMLNHSENLEVAATPAQIETITAPVTPAPQPAPQKEEAKILANATNSQKVEEFPEQVIEDEKPAAPEHRGMPTREELTAYARDTLLMKVDDPATKKALDEKPVEELVKELNYPI